jgi:hypothetical protein
MNRSSKSYAPVLWHDGRDLNRKDQPKKPRAEYLIATTKGEVSEIGVRIGADGRIEFASEMINARVEATYERPKKPKVVHSIAVDPDKMYIGADRALLANYDRVFAVDTNTREISGHRISLTGVVEVRPTRAFGQVLFDPRLFVEFVDVEAKPEQLGWLVTARIINQSPDYQVFKKIALLVDCDEMNIPAYNARTLAVYRRTMLPERLTLVQATSDTGGEYVPNAAIKYADGMGKHVLGMIASGRLPMNTSRAPAAEPFAAIRMINVTRLPDQNAKQGGSGLANFRLTVKVPRIIQRA